MSCFAVCSPPTSTLFPYTTLFRSPSLALPFSLVGTFAVMYALDYSLDNLSMMALTLSVGFVVDDAIVMLENIVHHDGVVHQDRKSTRLNSSHANTSYAVFCLKKKK